MYRNSFFLLSLLLLVSCNQIKFQKQSIKKEAEDIIALAQNNQDELTRIIHREMNFGMVR